MAAALFLFNVFEPDPKSGAQAAARLFDAAQEAWVMFEAAFEPVVFRFKADQHARRFTMAGDDDFLGLRLAQVSGQIVLDFGQGASFVPDFRIVRAVTQPPIWLRVADISRTQSAPLPNIRRETAS